MYLYSFLVEKYMEFFICHKHFEGFDNPIKCMGKRLKHREISHCSFIENTSAIMGKEN